MRSRASLALALSVTVLGGAGVLLAATAGPAGAAKPASPSVHTSAPGPAAPSHPLTVELPGLATVSVNVPDVPALLGAGRQSAVTKAPDRPAEPDPQPSKPVATRAAGRPSTPVATPRSSAAVAPRRVGSPAPTTGRPKTTGSARAISDTRQVNGNAGAKLARKPASHRKPAAAKARPIAEVFEGMLHPGLPVWLLLGIVVACGAGTVVVVRSAGRKSLT